MVGSYNPDGTQYVDDNMRRSYSGKVSWQIAPSHQLHFYELMVQKAAYHRPSGEAEARQFRESVTAIYQFPNKKHTEQLRWTGVLSSRLLAEVGGSFQHGPVIAPERPEVQHGDIRRLRLGDPDAHGGSPDLQLEPAIPRGAAIQPELRGGRS